VEQSREGGREGGRGRTYLEVLVDEVDDVIDVLHARRRQRQADL
jgi:hypothetical protein